MMFEDFEQLAESGAWEDRVGAASGSLDAVRKGAAILQFFFRPECIKSGCKARALPLSNPNTFLKRSSIYKETETQDYHPFVTVAMILSTK